jgi:hypothetical protein
MLSRQPQTTAGALWPARRRDRQAAVYARANRLAPIRASVVNPPLQGIAATVAA